MDGWQLRARHCTCSDVSPESNSALVLRIFFERDYNNKIKLNQMFPVCIRRKKTTDSSWSSCNPCQSSVIYGNIKITQRAINVSEPSECSSWTLYVRRRRRNMSTFLEYERALVISPQTKRRNDHQFHCPSVSGTSVSSIRLGFRDHYRLNKGLFQVSSCYSYSHLQECITCGEMMFGYSEGDRCLSLGPLCHRSTWRFIGKIYPSSPSALDFRLRNVCLCHSS